MNILKIEKDVPMPTAYRDRVSKYKFLEELVVGDSFIIDLNTTGFFPRESARACYSYAGDLRERGGRFQGFRIRTQTLTGSSDNPKSIRIWRVA